MKNYLVLFMVLMGVILSSCQEDPYERGGVNPYNPADGEVAALTLRVGSLRTRADQVEVLPGEAEMKSVACFVRTKDFGKPGDAGYKQGAFLAYFLTEAADIKEVSTGNFEVNLKVQSPSVAGKTDVAVFTNYKENGLETALQGVEQWDDLFNLVTTTATATGLRTPLMMFGYKEVTLSYTIPATETITLQRVVARFDIENKAADAPKKPFLLKSVEVINPKSYAYLIPGNEEAFDIPVLTTGFNKVDCSDNKTIKGIYTYEAANDGSVAHTALLVRGTLDGQPYSKRIDLMQDGEIIPLVRNTRYLITLTPTPDGSGIDWSFTIDDWSEGTLIPVNPTYQKPVTSNMTFEDASGKAIPANSWNDATKACLLGAISAGDKIKFTVENLQDTRAVLSFVNGDWEDLGITTEEGKEAFIQKTDSTVATRAMIREQYEITFPAMPTTHFDMEVRIENRTKPGYYESFHLIFLPEFDCMVEEPKMINASGTHIVAGWSQSTKSFLLEHQQANTKITFKVKTFHSSQATLTAVTGSLADLGITEKDIKKTDSVPEGNYVVETYEVLFPTMIVKNGKAKVTIANTIKPEKGDEFYLDGMGIYPGVNIRAVRIGNLLWAPVNVGASSVDNTNPTTASTGYYYQWGRNTKFTQNPAPSKAQGGQHGNIALSTADGNSIFYYEGGSDQPYYDWLRNNASEQATRNARWSTPANTPCPTGWRLPTKAEADQFKTARNGFAVREEKQKRWKITGDDGQALYFPQTGDIGFSGGSVSAAASNANCYLWISDNYVHASHGYAYMIQINGSNAVSSTSNWRAYGYPIRCVKSI
ncbi:uncharacterized protein (TIGR02145 family) [Parabacteroides sp. PFB2-10]|uniref:FISUMP domain-containing protein n=1 Tax=Parabacteroides sp. PFB2-10 TaxID=1742405 RepID=UPI0024757A2D|nr:FISUMP domain-containing protein [Parabacteroides sp. PFB2-10]MDH6312757.1 uncharacterized protein (TIGR02145 family) [Parabacteroides sp. PFB2-10]